MKLNNRVSALTLPVFLASFLAVAAGLYAIEHHSIYSLNRSSAELETTELKEIFTRYDLVGKSFLTSLIHSDAFLHFLDIQDKHLRSMVLSSGLDEVLKSLADLSSDHFSLTFIRGNGELDYYYENSLDPFSEPDPYLKKWVKERISEEKSNASLYYREKRKIAHCKILDSFTLKSPTIFNSPSTIAILVVIGPKEFFQRSGELEATNRTVTFTPEEIPLPPFNELEARKTIPGFGTISVKVQQEAVDKSLRQIFLRLILGLLLLSLATYLVQQWLLRKYVTGPISSLEKQLVNIDLNGTRAFHPLQSDDEIGNLSKSFETLYNKLQKTYQGTKELAERDSLTTLYNRRVFNLILDKLVRRAKTSTSKVALLYIDIDNFKFVNDTYGHTIGDTLLRTFAMRLHEVVRGSDYVYKNHQPESTTARLAGDEFAVIVHSYDNDDVPGKVARRILSLCASGFSFKEGVFPVSLSIGVATYPEDGDSAEELVVNADSAMYLSKKTGKNRISFYSGDMTETSKRQQAVELHLKQLDIDELTLYYMPIFDAQTGDIYAFEALLRWFSKPLGPVGPTEIMPLAESLGIEREIEFWVLDRAFSDLATIHKQFGSHVHLALNISAATLFKDNFSRSISPLIAKHGIDPSLIILEISESFCQDQSPTKMLQLRQLDDKGFQLAIDDFGSGSTSLVQLLDLPVQMVKLDKSFIEKSLHSDKQPILTPLFSLLNTQGLLVAAKNLENENEIQILTENGCDFLQGFHFGFPCPLSKLSSTYGKYEEKG